MFIGRIRRNRPRAFLFQGCLVLGLAGAMGFAAAFAAPARAAESALAGVHIYSPAVTILEKFGNPTQVLPGAQSASNGANGGSTMGPGMGGGRMGMGGAPFGPFGPGGGGAPGGIEPLPQMPMGNPGGMPGEFGPPGMNMNMKDRGGPMGFAGPGGPGGMPMGMGGPPGFGGRFGPGGGYGPGAMNGQGENGGQTYENQEVWYIYNKPNDITYEFLLSPTGRAIEMAAAGYKGGATTSRGISLGSAYKDVLAKYGFPENQSVQGGIVFLSYVHRAHVAFQLMDNKVISVIVAYVH